MTAPRSSAPPEDCAPLDRTIYLSVLAAVLGAVLLQGQLTVSPPALRDELLEASAIGPSWRQVGEVETAATPRDLCGGVPLVEGAEEFAARFFADSSGATMVHEVYRGRVVEGGVARFIDAMDACRRAAATDGEQVTVTPVTVRSDLAIACLEARGDAPPPQVLGLVEGPRLLHLLSAPVAPGVSPQLLVDAAADLLRKTPGSSGVLSADSQVTGSALCASGS